MSDHYPALIGIGMVAVIVYLTRAGGYLLGLQLRHVSGIKPILEALPGCAFMAILVPVVRQGSVTDVVAMACVVGIMWKTDSVVLATIIGVTVLLFGAPYLSQLV